MTSRRSACVLAVGALALALPACGGSAGSPRRGPAAQSIRTAPLETMVEAQAQLMSDPAGTLDALRRLGVDAVRVFVPWASLAPDPSSRVAPSGFAAASPGAYPAAAWSPYDAIVRAAAARRVVVNLTLEAPAPRWATSSGLPPGAAYPGAWRPRAAAYGLFVHAVAARYGGSYTPSGQSSALPRVRMWSIWNEPNYGTQLAPQATDHTLLEVSPSLYRGLIDAAWRALQATGHGHDTILLGELAPRGQTTGPHPGDFDGMVPLRFVRALYCVDGSLTPLRGAAARARGCPPGGGSGFPRAHPALFQAAGFALHLYALGAEPPFVSTSGEPDYADLASVGRFEHELDRIMGVHGSGKRFSIYDTEFGYKTNPPYTYGAALTTAAAYLNWAEYLHWRDPRLGSYDQYLLTDPPAPSNFATGLEFATGAPKPSLAAFRMALFLPVTRGPAGASLEVWGCVRPADVARAQTGRPQTAVLQFARGGGRFTDLERLPITNADGYLDLHVTFPSSGSVRLAWREPGGPVAYSRAVTVSMSG